MMSLLPFKLTRIINFADHVKWDPCTLVENSIGLNNDVSGPVCICIDKKVSCIQALALCKCKPGYYWTGVQCLEESACTSS